MPRKGKHPSNYDYDDYDDGFEDYYDDYSYGQDNDAQYSHQDDIAESSRIYESEEDLSSTRASNRQQISSHTDQISIQQGSNLWRCSICTFDNREELQSCDICGVIRNRPASDLASASDSPPKNLCKFSGASVLAKSLLAPLPPGKLKKSRTFQQLKNRLSNGGVNSSQRSDIISGTFQDLQKLFVSDSEAKSVEIVPFKFDSPSPDDMVVAGRRSGIKSSTAKASASTGVSTSKANSARGMNEKVAVSLTANSILNKRVTQGPRHKQNQNGISISRLPRNGTQLSEGLKDVNLNADCKDEGQANDLKKGPPLDIYKPEPWMLDGFRQETKHLIHLAVVGHVDAGKSTLMGRLLHILGRVSQKEMHKYEKEAKQKGKGSFAYAWVLDESAEERARGVTMTVAVTHFETPKFRVVLLDSPGHKDFVPNMISGASQADAAILVVDASVGAFEAGLEGEGQGGGQTREHTQLVRSFGVEQIIVAVNKMDAADYSQERFNTIKESLRPFLRHCGFKDSAVKWVPLSAMENQNLVAHPSESCFKSWYSGPSLLEAIDTFEPPVRNISKPFQMPIAEVLRTRSLGQAAVSGKLEGGAIKMGTKVLVMPVGTLVTVKGIEQDGKPVASARAGDSVDVGLQGVEPSLLVPGGVLCHPDYPVPAASRLEVRVLILEISMPILRGSQVVFHCHHVKEPARIAELVSVLDQKSGAVLKKKPRCLLANQSAIIEVVPERGVCVEEYSRYKALGRVTLRDEGKTLAVGIVTRVVEYE